MNAIRIAVLVIGLLPTFAWAGDGANIYNLGVDGLGCPFCAYGLEKQLSTLSGVGDVAIDLEGGVAVVTMAGEAILDAEAAKLAVEEAGFDLRSFTPASGG